jgi:hypothetical protein
MVFLFLKLRVPRVTLKGNQWTRLEKLLEEKVLCGQLKEEADLHSLIRVNLAVGDQPTLLVWVNDCLKDFYGSAGKNDLWSKPLATLRGNMIRVLEFDEITGKFLIIQNITFYGKTHHLCFFCLKRTPSESSEEPGRTRPSKLSRQNPFSLETHRNKPPLNPITTTSHR